MDFRFSDDFIELIGISRDEALRTGWHNITADHIMLGILRLRECPECGFLEKLGADPAAFKADLDKGLFCSEQIPWEERESIMPSEGAVSMLQHAALEARRCGAACIGPLHFVLALRRIPGSLSHDWLEARGIGLRQLVDAAGMKWEQYGLIQAGPAREGTAGQAVPGQEAPVPDPALMAAAIEQRIREGYSTDNPHVS